jgi:hypothetical protein
LDEKKERFRFGMDDGILPAMLDFMILGQGRCNEVELRVR